MTAAVETRHPTTAAPTRSIELAERLEDGTRALIALAAGLSDEEWRTVLRGDGRPIGVVVHHVASVYPIEIELAQMLAAGKPVLATMADVHAMNAGHATEHATATKEEAIALLATNGAAAANAIRALSDRQLANAAPVSLYDGAPPLTCQFLLEDHAVRHSYHHLARIRAALNK